MCIFFEFSWDLRTRSLCVINRVDNVNWPPIRDFQADVSNVSPSSECFDEELLSKRHLKNLSILPTVAVPRLLKKFIP